MTDAVFVVITLAWLLTTHSWLTASSARVRYANGLTGPTLVTSRGIDGHAGALARARPDLGRAGQGVQPRIVGCDVHDARALVGRGVRLEHLTPRVRNASTPAFHYLA